MDVHRFFLAAIWLVDSRDDRSLPRLPPLSDVYCSAFLSIQSLNKENDNKVNNNKVNNKDNKAR